MDIRAYLERRFPRPDPLSSGWYPPVTKEDLKLIATAVANWNVKQERVDRVFDAIDQALGDKKFNRDLMAAKLLLQIEAMNRKTETDNKIADALAKPRICIPDSRHASLDRPEADGADPGGDAPG